MTTPPNGTSTEEQPPPADPGSGPRVSGAEMRDLGLLRTSVHDRKIAGVAGGIARHFDIDPMLVRVALVVLVFFGGAGVLLYGAGWLIIPDEENGRATINLDHRTRNVALWIVAGIAGISAVSDSVGQWHFPWPVVIVGLAVLGLVSRGQHIGHWGSWNQWRHTPPPGVAPRETGHEGEPVDYSQEWSDYYKAKYAGKYDAGKMAAYQEKWDAKAAAYRAKYDAKYARYRAPYVRDRRRRGPILFGFTLALAALGVGVLVTARLAGVDVPPGAYPAVVAATCGVMLLVSAWYGRGGGLIPVGLVAVLAMLVASSNGGWSAGQTIVRPASAAGLHDSYRIGAGELSVDLTHVKDLSALDGRTLTLHSRVGHIVVDVPATGLAVDANATIDGGGETVLFGSDRNGSASVRHGGGADAPELTIDAELFFGQIEIRTENAS
ncbi:MAG: PspC domain-containing protein [Nocardioidaceae bacterium]|nr:PspC domain-containing protein [Nocardioidaceae bacterium]